jgi:hypothetical protein
MKDAKEIKKLPTYFLLEQKQRCVYISAMYSSMKIAQWISTYLLWEESLTVDLLKR